MTQRMTGREQKDFFKLLDAGHDLKTNERYKATTTTTTTK